MFIEQAKEIQAELSAIYRELHQIPELAYNEYKTSEYIKKRLEEYGIKYKTVFKTGVCADIMGDSMGETVILRADIDALPIKEESGVEFASENGNMHACGHDVHTTVLLGTAKVLNSSKDRIKGTVRLVFQPAEEGDGGAEFMIKDGIMKDVSAAFALHVEPLEKVGNIQVKYGPIMASPDDFELTVKGKGGHGAYPHTCVDTILTASMIVNAYQTVVSRNIDPMTAAAVSVCSFHSGNCTNAIPDTAYLTGTARSIDYETREKLMYLLEKIAKDTAKSMGAECDFKFKPLFPPTVNDKEMTDLVAISAQKLGLGVAWLDKASMAGDDFAYFLEKVPGAYFKLGVGNKNQGAVYPIHSPKFKIDEQALHIGTAVMSQIACDYLSR